MFITERGDTGNGCYNPVLMTRRTLLACALALGFVASLSRPLAGQLGSRSAEEWIRTLESPSRIAALKVDETVAKLRLKPGDHVADIGAGSGVFVVALMKAVTYGDRIGKVYAVDIDKGLLDIIEKKKV